MNSASGREGLLKQTTGAWFFPVRFSVLFILAEEFIPRRWRQMTNYSITLLPKDSVGKDHIFLPGQLILNTLDHDIQVLRLVDKV